MIGDFCGEYLFLSNFYPCLIEYEGFRYYSVEAAYQAQKFITTKLKENKIKSIFTTLNAVDAKALGETLYLREDWEEIRLDLMKKLLDIKFSDKELQDKLLLTGEEELIQINYWHDTFYGSCVCEEHQGYGENHLGNYLMELREKIKNERNN